MRSLAPPSPAAPPARPRSLHASSRATATAVSPPDSRLDCRHFEEGCSGCTLAEALDAPPLLAEARSFFAAPPYNAELALSHGPLHGWRNRARLAVRGTAERPLVGLFAAGTHTVLPIPDCAAHHPSINACVRALCAALTEVRVQPYDEQKHTGQLRYVQAATLGRDKEAAVELTLVWAEPPPAAGGPPPAAALLLPALRAACGATGVALASVHLHYNFSKGNGIVSSDGGWQELYSAQSGEDWHWENLGGVDVAFTPAAFCQANLGAFDTLLHTLSAQLCTLLGPAGAGVPTLELYSGTGAIGLSLLSSGVASSLTAVEVSAAAQPAFEAAYTRLKQSKAGGIGDARMLIATAGGEEALSHLRCELLVIDPPRRGMDAPLLKLLCEGGKEGPRLLAYVSCGWAALQRELPVLYAAGWRLAAQPTAFLFFPGTDALETLCVLRRD